MIVPCCHYSLVMLGFQILDLYLQLCLAEIVVSFELMGYVHTGQASGLFVIVFQAVGCLCCVDLKCS